MGNDGGSIPTRRELAKTAARNPNTTEMKATQLESQTHAWTNCPISHRPLSTPIVSDCTGVLYNKDAVIETLLPSTDTGAPPVKTKDEEAIGARIRSLRDIVEVKFQVETDPVTKEERRICPITSKELGASIKAVYLVPCGHAFSEVAIREIASDTCISCNELYKPTDIIPILPLSKEEITRLADRIQALRESGLTHSLKKAAGNKKKKKHTEAAGIEVPESGLKDITESNGSSIEKSKKRAADLVEGGSRTNGTSIPQPKSGTATPSGAIKNAATASLTAKVMEEQDDRNKRRKLGLNDNLKSLFSSNGAGQAGKGGDFMTRGFSIPKRA